MNRKGSPTQPHLQWRETSPLRSPLQVSEVSGLEQSTLMRSPLRSSGRSHGGTPNFQLNPVFENDSDDGEKEKEEEKDQEEKISFIQGLKSRLSMSPRETCALGSSGAESGYSSSLESLQPLSRETSFRKQVNKFVEDSFSSLKDVRNYSRSTSFRIPKTKHKDEFGGSLRVKSKSNFQPLMY